MGGCLGYLEGATAALLAAQQTRGRAPTRGELARLNATPADAEGTGTGLLLHSCWTYWGHSGAPLFDAHGRVAGLHCAWDERSGARHAQPLSHLRDAIAKALIDKGDDEHQHQQHQQQRAGASRTSSRQKNPPSGNRDNERATRADARAKRSRTTSAKNDDPQIIDLT